MSQDEYDGHDKYVENARKEARAGAFAGYVEKYPGVPLAAWMLLAGMHTLVGVGVGALIAYQVLHWVRANVADVGIAWIVVLYCSLLVGMIGGGLYIGLGALAVRRAPRWQTMAVINLVALLLIWFGMVLPMRQSNDAEVVAKQQVVDREEQELQRQRALWFENLRKTAPPAAPGVVPPMLQVKDEGSTVHVLNIGTEELYVGLARVRPDAAATNGWVGCGMSPPFRTGLAYRVEKFQGGVRKGYILSPGASLDFALDPACAAAFRDAAIEYRIGGWGDSAAWWSDSALASPVQKYQLVQE